MHSMAWTAGALTSAILLMPAVVRSETPLARSVVRTIPVSGWSVSCFGDETELGDCSAERRYRSMSLAIRSRAEGVTVSVDGGCSAVVARMEARHVRSSTGASDDAHAIASLVQHLAARRAAECGELPPRRGLTDSARKTAALVLGPLRAGR